MVGHGHAAEPATGPAGVFAVNTTEQNVTAGVDPSMAEESLSIDVIIVNYRAASEVLQAVQRLCPEGQAWPHGVIHIVDNSEDPSQADALNRAMGHRGEVRVRVMERNVGFGAACNAAWAQSEATWVLLLNPDAQITPSAVRALARALERRPQAGAGSPRTWWDRPGGWVLPCPTPQRPAARLARASASRRDARQWAHAQVQQTRQRMAEGEAFQVNMLAGAVLMVRRQAAQDAGGLFDPAFFMYFEDADLSDRLRGAGWQLMLVPQVDAVHEWRHQGHKGALMQAGEAVYLRRQSSLYRALRRLWPGAEAMGALPRRVGVLHTPREAARVLGPVSALSPSASGDPAWVRWSAARPLDEAEWALLEPGAYWAQTDGDWVGFVKGHARSHGARDEAAHLNCPCCATPLRPGQAAWHKVCPSCAYESASLQPCIDDGSDPSRAAAPVLDETLRREALQTLRQRNFQRVLHHLRPLASSATGGPLSLLDVGAAHGWFVFEAAAHGWQAQGLEPDARVARQALEGGAAVRQGYFPQALQTDERFDAITFHDVFEHLPDLPQMLAAVEAHLNPQGLLVLNLPSTQGFFYRVARRLARHGLMGPWHRLWQLGMPSPHLHYFNAENLEQLLRRHGFEVVVRADLPSLVRQGLMARLRFDPRSAAMAPLLGPLLWLLVPLIQRLPADICLLIARRCQAEASDRP